MGKVFNKGLDENDRKEGHLKRLKDIEGKNEQQLEAIKDLGEKQLNAIEKQNKNKAKTIEKDDKILYLREGIDKLFKIYAGSFNRKSINSLEVLAKNESIDYKNLSYKILFHDETDVGSHEIIFLKKFSTLYDLLKDIVTNEIHTTNENVDQIKFIVCLIMRYYDKDFFLEKTEIYKDKSGSWQNKAFDMATIIFKNGKEKLLRTIKIFVSKKNKEDILKDQKDGF